MQTPAARMSAVTLLLLLFATFSFAAEPNPFAGTWATKLAGRYLLVLRLNHINSDGNVIEGTLDRPGHIQIAAAKTPGSPSVFSQIGDGVRHDKITASRLDGSILHLTVQNASDPSDQDKFNCVLKDGHMEMQFEELPPGIVLDAFIFLRAPNSAAVATDWDYGKEYNLDVHNQPNPDTQDQPNAEMKAIFDEDQRVRQPGQQIDWSVVSRTDADRREQTRKLLAADALHTGKDFEEAAFLFQHGSAPNDYLLAHTLAMVAVSRGDASAIWIACATLDRYLVNIQQKQIFGTQYNRTTPAGGSQTTWTQEPYDRTLISDALRQQLGVPSQDAQAKQLEAYQNEK